MTKFNNPHDEYIWEGSAASGVILGEGDVQSNIGWFAGINLVPGFSADEDAALAHYGTRFLILREDTQGFVTVIPFDDEVKRNRRLIELGHAYQMGEAGIDEADMVDALTGYRRALEWAAGYDGEFRSWSEEAQQQTNDDVTEFVLSEIENLRVYMETVDRNWQAVGGDFAFTRLRTGMGFAEFAGGEVVDAILVTARAYTPVHVIVNERGAMEVVES